MLPAPSLEEIRNYWAAHPPGIRHTSEPLGSRGSYAEISRWRYLVEDHIPEMADFGGFPNRRLCEIGCGLGTDLAEYARGGAKVVGGDLAWEAVRAARDRFRLEGLSGSFVCFDARRLPFRPGVFDVVYAWGSLHHSPDVERSVAEVRRVLRAGGTFLGMLYHRHSLKVLWEIVFVRGILRGGLLRSSFQSLVNTHTEASGNSPLSLTFSRGEVRRLLREYHIERLEVRYLYKYRSGPYRERRLVPRLSYALLPRPVWRRLEAWLGWHLCFRAVRA